jgi:hypothetical protein
VSWAATQHSTRTQEGAPVLQKNIHLGGLGLGFSGSAQGRKQARTCPAKVNAIFVE